MSKFWLQSTSSRFYEGRVNDRRARVLTSRRVKSVTLQEFMDRDGDLDGDPDIVTRKRSAIGEGGKLVLQEDPGDAETRKVVGTRSVHEGAVFQGERD